MLKVILINAPYIDIYGPIKMAAGHYFPLGIGYIASYIKQFGNEVKLLDPEAQRLDDKDISNIIEQEKPDLIGISSATPNFYNTVNIAKIAKNISKNIYVAVGGAHASAVPENIIENHHDIIDFVCIGEGEITTTEICKFINGEITDKTKIKGICYWDNGKAIRNEPRELFADMDSLPFPARELVDMNLYYAHAHNSRHKHTIQMITSRGCPFQCTFCASGLTLGKQFRTHSPEYIVSEIEFLIKKYKTKHFLIQDDTFTINKERLLKTCELIISRQLNIEWFCFSQVSAVDEEILKIMKKAGCYSIGFGIESGDEKVLKNICKNIKLEQAENALRTANKLGYKTQAFYIFGNEGENKETINKTIKFALKTNPTLAFFNILVPYPGTAIFDKFVNIPINQIDWQNYVAIGVNPVGDIGNLSKRQLQLYILKAYFLFYFRPSQIYRILKTIKTKFELFEYSKGAVALVMQMSSWFRGK